MVPYHMENIRRIIRAVSYGNRKERRNSRRTEDDSLLKQAIASNLNGVLLVEHHHITVAVAISVRGHHASRLQWEEKTEIGGRDDEE